MPETKTTTAKVPDTPAAGSTSGDHDRVVMASRLADGTPDQSPDFEFVGDRDTTLEATKTQLATSAVAAVDAERQRAVATPEAGEEGSSEPDPVVAEDVKAKESAARSAEKAAEAEVAARFGDKR